MVLWSVVALCGGGGGGQPPQTTYLDPTRQTVATPSDLSSGSTFCDPTYSATLTFDPEAIGTDSYLDLAIAKSVRDVFSSPVIYSCVQNYNNTTGGFPALNGEFSHIWSPCLDTSHVYNVVFGKLRPWTTRKDLAVLRSSRTELYYNTGNGMETTPHQGLQGLAKDASWGAFSSDDNYEDLAVTGGNQIRIYQSLNNGNVNGTPYTFSVAAGQIVLAQMNKSVYLPNEGNMWDLVSINGSTLSIRLNNNSNGFNTAQDVVMGSQIYSVAVGDINDDGYNDVVVAMISGPEVRVYLNDQSGGLVTPAVWTLNGATYIPGNPQVVIGDIGGPSDATRLDGWNDILLTGYGAPVRVFANQGSGSYFLSTPQQDFPPSDFTNSVGKAMLADVENKGGLSLIYAAFYSPVGGNGYRAIFVNKHVGDPAPAPPQHVSAGYTACPSVQHPVISWASNSERDLSGYNVYKSYDGGQQWSKQNTSLITGNSWTDYSEGVACEVHQGYPVWRNYYVTSVDNAVNESSASTQVAAIVDGQAPIQKQGAGSAVKPESYALHPAYPNPFNPSTQIRFDLRDAGVVSLAVHDVLGRKIADIVNGYRDAGYQSTTWNAMGVASGVYFARLTVSNQFGQVQFTKINKLILMK